MVINQYLLTYIYTTAKRNWHMAPEYISHRGRIGLKGKKRTLLHVRIFYSPSEVITFSPATPLFLPAQYFQYDSR